MLNKIFKIFFIISIFILPVVSLAQNFDKTDTLLRSASKIVTEVLIPLAFVLALLFFFWGIAKYVWSVGEAKDEAKSVMIWGIVALFVMSSVWGLVAFIQGELLGGPGPNNIEIPTIGGGGGGGGSGTNFPDQEVESNI